MKQLTQVVLITAFCGLIMAQDKTKTPVDPKAAAKPADTKVFPLDRADMLEIQNFQLRQQQLDTERSMFHMTKCAAVGIARDKCTINPAKGTVREGPEPEEKATPAPGK
jgi:hypothetical protein